MWRAENYKNQKIERVEILFNLLYLINRKKMEVSFICYFGNADIFSTISISILNCNCQTQIRFGVWKSQKKESFAKRKPKKTD